jgi:hypothetical protein
MVRSSFLTPSYKYLARAISRAVRIVSPPMKNIPLLSSVLLSILAVGTAGAQSPAPSILGEWRADAPLPNGVVQTFRFGPDGKFDLAMALAVDGTYKVVGNQLIETVVIPTMGVTRTDTATFAIAGDSLVVHETASAPPRVLHRSGNVPASASIIGDWAIQVGTGMAAHYVFDADGAMHVRAKVGDEEGKYVIRSDTLHLSNDKTFQLPATAQFAVVDSVLTLTPANGKQSRHFHKVVTH